MSAHNPIEVFQLRSKFKQQLLRILEHAGTPTFPHNLNKCDLEAFCLKFSSDIPFLKKKLQTKMSEDSSDVLQTFSLKIKLQTIAYLIPRKLQTKTSDINI